MEIKVNLSAVYAPSEDVVAREVCDEFILVPITSGVGDLEDAIFTLNETGKAIWDKLDGKRTLKNVTDDLSLEFETPAGEVDRDVSGIVEELLKIRMLVEIKKD